MLGKPRGQRRRSRKLRRGRKGRESRTHGDLVVLHSNIRGFNSKKESLKEVLNDLNDVDVCILNETGLRGRNKVTLPGYLS